MTYRTLLAGIVVLAFCGLTYHCLFAESSRMTRGEAWVVGLFVGYSLAGLQWMERREERDAEQTA